MQAHHANMTNDLGLLDITHLVRFAIHHCLLPQRYIILSRLYAICHAYLWHILIHFYPQARLQYS